MFFDLGDEDTRFVNAIISFYQEQNGIFCIEDLRKKLDLYRTQAVRILESLKNSELLETLSSDEVRKILRKKSDKRKHYFRINMKSKTAKEYLNNKYLIAVDVLEEFGKESLELRKKLIKKIKNPEMRSYLSKNLKLKTL